MKIYTVRNRLIGRYMQPVFVNEEPKDFIESQRRFCIMSKDDALKAHLNECELYFCGEYDDELCEFHLLAKPDFLIDLASFFKESSNA